MSCHCVASFPGPIPDGMMRVSADISDELFEQLEEACRRIGVDLDHLVIAALMFAAMV